MTFKDLKPGEAFFVLGTNGIRESGCFVRMSPRFERHGNVATVPSRVITFRAEADKTVGLTIGLFRVGLHWMADDLPVLRLVDL